jgi:hypothetical protein
MAEAEAQPRGRTGPGVPGVVGLLGTGVILQACWLVAGWSSPAHRIHYDALPQEDADALVTAALMITCAVLVARARSREFGLCITVCLGAELLASIQDFRPSTFLGPDGESLQVLLVLFLVCGGAAGVLSAVLLWRSSRERTGSAPGHDRAAVRRRRVIVLAFGLPAVAVGTVAAFFDSGSVRYGPLSADESFACCAVQRLDHWYQAGAVASYAVITAFVLLAAFTPSRTRATAWLVAPALCGLGTAAWFVAEKAWPAQSLVGFGRPNLLDGATEFTFEPGYWLGLLVCAALATGALLLPVDRETVNAASA